MKDFSIIIAVLVIGFSLYLMYRFFKDFKEHQEAKKNFLQTHKKVERVTDSNGWLIFYTALIASMITLLVSQFNQLDVIMKMAYGFAIVFGISLIFDVLITREVFFSEDGFFMDKQYYRFKSIKKIEAPKGRFFSNYTLRFLDGEELKFSKKMGLELSKRFEERKQKKKEKKHR